MTSFLEIAKNLGLWKKIEGKMRCQREEEAIIENEYGNSGWKGRKRWQKFTYSGPKIIGIM
jgi:hypothetical protein